MHCIAKDRNFKTMIILRVGRRMVVAGIEHTSHGGACTTMTQEAAAPCAHQAFHPQNEINYAVWPGLRCRTNRV